MWNTHVILQLPADFHFLPSIVDTQQKCEGLWRVRLLQIRVVDTVGGGDRPVATNLADNRIKKEASWGYKVPGSGRIHMIKEERHVMEKV